MLYIQADPDDQAATMGNSPGGKSQIVFKSVQTLIAVLSWSADLTVSFLHLNKTTVEHVFLT